VSCFGITVPDTFTIVDPENPLAFADAVAQHPEIDQIVADHVITWLAMGRAPPFWAWDLTSASEGAGAPRAINVIVVTEPLPADVDAFLPEYVTGLADAHGLDPTLIESEVVELAGGRAIEAMVSTLDGPDGTPMDTMHYVIPDRHRVLVVSVSSRPDWMTANRDAVRTIAGSIEPTC
jgi:hypothetical protein